MALYLVGISPDQAVKSRRTRLRFLRRLLGNLRDALAAAGTEYTIENRWSRLAVEADDGLRERIASVFGVGSVAAVDARLPAELDRIVTEGERLYADAVRGRRFAVRARRAKGTRCPFRSQDVAVELGAALNRYGPVNLEDPEVTVFVEVRDGEAWLFSERFPGVGGLPLGVEGRAVCLLSGGFDSPVAAWMMMKRGIALDYVFCNLGGEAYERLVLSVAKVLADAWSFGERPRMHVVPFAEVLDALRAEVRPRYWQVVLKRLMYRTAGAVASETGGKAIITGEAVGQVSSQTLGNLRAIDPAAPLPVLRPLLGLDKQEIIDRARTIGTEVLSARIREYCAIGTAKPVTDAKVQAVEDEESRLDLSVVERAVAARKVLDLRALTAQDLVQPYLFTTEIPEEAVVLDCREAHQYRAWHYPGAGRRDLSDLAGQFKRLDKAKRYVLYCQFGMQTACVAELMQREGYEAYSFRGGAPALRKYAVEKGLRVEVLG